MRHTGVHRGSFQRFHGIVYSIVCICENPKAYFVRQNVMTFDERGCGVLCECVGVGGVLSRRRVCRQTSHKLKRWEAERVAPSSYMLIRYGERESGRQ